MRQGLLVILIGWLLLVLPLSAQDESPEISADSVEDGEVTEVDADEDDSPEYEDDLDDFIPSREIPPDEQVTFPVDI